MSVNVTSGARMMAPSHVLAPDVASIPSAVGVLEATIDVHRGLVTSLRDRLEAAGVLATQPPAAQANGGTEACFCALATHLNGFSRKLESLSDVVRDISNRLQL